MLFGASAVNESMITGESLPQPKRANDRVVGGTINGSGVLYVLVVGAPLPNISPPCSSVIDRQSSSSRLPLSSSHCATSAVVLWLASIITETPSEAP